MTQNEEALLDDARRIVDQLELPAHPTWEVVESRVEAHFGKPLHVTALDGDEWASITGLFLEAEHCGYVFYRASDPPLYQRHSILHEFGHILHHSDDCSILEQLPRALVDGSGLSGAIRSAAARGLEVSAEELAAETIGYALAEKLFGARTGRESAFGL